MKRALMFLGIFNFLIVAAMVKAQRVQAEPQKKGTSTLTGIVLGPDDKPVARAAVSYQSSSGSAPHAIHTDAHGRFTITKLQADNYDVRASGRGVFSEWQKNVTLHDGQTREITLRLIYARKIPKSYTGKKSKP